MKRWLVSVALVGVVGLLTACGPGTPGAGSAGASPGGTDAGAGETSSWTMKEPCTLLTDAEASAAVGSPLRGTPSDEPFNGYVHCSWDRPGSPSPKGAEPVTVAIAVRPAACEQLKDLPESSTGIVRTVSGLGDGATEVSTLGKLNVASGDYCFFVVAPANARVDLAKRVLSRLQ